MARSPWFVPLSLLLAFALFFTGCVSSRPRSIDHEDGTVSVGTSKEGGTAEKARARDVAVALYIAGAFLILGAVIVDLFILAWEIPNHREFYCTVEVVHVCYH